MKLLESIKLAMQVFPNSFINRNNEVILIPKFNVYIQLDDVKTNEDFKVKLCEWLSRDCSCALRYSQDKRLIRYWQDNTNAFNKICGTNFTMEQMSYIYTYLGNGIKHDLTKQFVRNGFDLFVIEKYAQKGNKQINKMDCNIQNIKCEICGRVFHKVCHAEPYEKICDNSECFHKKFWLEIIKEKNEHVIINGICYYLDKAHPMSDSLFRGYGGREFKIKLHTGEIVVTNNLWHNGEVPKEFRDRLPDNAEFVK